MTGFVRCACCNQPIAVTAEDVGLTVACPRTRKLVPVRAADLRSAAADQPAAPPTPAPRARPTSPRTAAPARPSSSPSNEAAEPPAPAGRSGQLFVFVCLFGLVAAAGGGAFLYVQDQLKRRAEADAARAAQEAELLRTPALPPAPPAVPPKPPSGRPAVAPMPRVAQDPPPIPPKPAAVAVVPPTPPAMEEADPVPAPRAIGALRLKELVRATDNPLDAPARRAAVAALGAVLLHGDADLSRGAARELAELGAEAEPARATLEAAAAASSDEVVRALAARARDAVTASINKKIHAHAVDLKAKEPEDRVRALAKIAAFGADARVVGEGVIEALRDKEGVVRSAAADALERISPKLLPHVAVIARGNSGRAAFDALGDLGSEAAIAIPLILFCNDDTKFWGGGDPTSRRYYEDLLSVAARIAPRDTRFAAAVLACVSAPNAKNERALSDRRLAGLAQLGVIDAKPAEKVAALAAGLGDGETAVQVIRALEGFGADAKPALDALRNLKTSKTASTRDAAVAAIAKIEAAR